MIVVVTEDGRVHLPSRGPSGPTTACGRTERVFVILDNSWDRKMACPQCLAIEAAADELLDELLEER